jgi:hypothetical protein
MSDRSKQFVLGSLVCGLLLRAVPAASQIAVFVHRTTGSNIFGSYTIIDDPVTNGDEFGMTARVIVRSRLDNLHDHPIAAFWDSTDRRWRIHNTDGAAMDTGFSFWVLAVWSREGAPGQWIHHMVYPPNPDPTATWLSHLYEPAFYNLGSGSAILAQSVEVEGAFEPEPIATFWDATPPAAGYNWTVANENLAAHSQDSNYLLCIDGCGLAGLGVVSSVHTVTEENRPQVYQTTTALDQPGLAVFATPRHTVNLPFPGFVAPFWVGWDGHFWTIGTTDLSAIPLDYKFSLFATRLLFAHDFESGSLHGFLVGSTP